MKIMFKFLFLLTLFAGFIGCSADDNGPNSDDEIPFSTEQIQGIWEITLYQNQVQNITYDGIDILLQFDQNGTISAFNEEATTFGSYEIREFQNGDEMLWQLEIGLNIVNDAHEVLEVVQGIWPIKRVLFDAAKIEFELVLNPQFDLEILHLTRFSGENN